MGEDEFHQLLSEQPQTARQFALWLGDQLSEDLESWDDSGGVEEFHVLEMTRNGVNYSIMVQVLQVLR